MPDTEELRETFGLPPGQAEGCGFPTAHLLALFDARTGFLQKVIPAPRKTHDMAHAVATHDALAEGNVLVGDRAFCSYAHLASLCERGLHGLFRAHQRLIVSFRRHRRQARGRGDKGLPKSRWLRRLGHWDQLVEYVKPKDRPSWLTAEQYAALPDKLVVRELRYRVRSPGGRSQVITLVTTLLSRSRYPAAALAALYGLRWRAEVNLKHLKSTLGLDVLHSQTVPGVVKELTVFAIIYNLVRRVMYRAGVMQGVPADRISFVDALRWLRSAIPGEALPRLLVNPERSDRHEPRVRKRRPKQFALMTKPRDELRKAQKSRGKQARAA